MLDYEPWLSLEFICFFLMSRALSDGSAFNVLRAGKLIRGQLRGLATLVDLHLHVFKK